MLKYIEVTGKTEDEAIANALIQLGMDRDDVSVEILERAKTGFLGIGSVPAKVKVSYEAPDEEPEEVFAPAEEEPVAEEAAAPEEEAEKVEPVAAEPCEDKVAEKITNFLSGLFAHMGVEATPVITREDDIYNVVLQGEDMGSLIGRRGETLDAIRESDGWIVHTHLAAPCRYMPASEEELALCRQWAQALKACGYEGRMSLEGKFDPDFGADITRTRKVLDLFNN